MKARLEKDLLVLNKTPEETVSEGIEVWHEDYTIYNKIRKGKRVYKVNNIESIKFMSINY